MRGGVAVSTVLVALELAGMSGAAEAQLPSHLLVGTISANCTGAAGKIDAQCQSIPEPCVAPCGSVARGCIVRVSDDLNQQFLADLTGYIKFVYLPGRANYAETVNYYAGGMKSRAEVIADSESYRRKWRYMNFFLEPDSVRIVEYSPPRLTVIFAYSYEYGRRVDGEQVSGRAVDQLDLRIAPNGDYVVAEVQEIVKRD